jgi:hypothetical protein
MADDRSVCGTNSGRLRRFWSPWADARNLTALIVASASLDREANHIFNGKRHEVGLIFLCHGRSVLGRMAANACDASRGLTTCSEDV